MRKIPVIMVLSLVLVLGLALNVMAFTVTDVSNDPNYILNQNGNNLKETYGFAGSLLVPDNVFNTTVINLDTIPPSTTSFPNLLTSDHNVVVNPATSFSAPYSLFRKDVTFTPQEIGSNNVQFTFQITNNTPFTWSNYEIILHNEGEVVSLPNTSSADFKGSVKVDTTTIPGDIIVEYFHDPAIGGSKLIDPGKTLNLILGLDLTNGPGPTTPEIEMTQIATAVPIPAALPLFGTGLLGLGLWGWRRKVKD